MKRRDPGLEPELEAFLEHRTIERRVPPELRARALAGARAIVAAEGAIAPPLLQRPSATLPTAVARGRGRFRIALAASIAVAGAAVGVMAALQGPSARAPQMTSPGAPSPVRGVPAPSFSPSSEPGTPPAQRALPSTSPRPARTTAKDEPFTAELDLLQRAHGAYTRRDFSVTLAQLAEHARRFPNGRLAEQREALRVRSLIGSGRADEAHRAAAAFAVRFPRSVLLPRLEETAKAQE
jgi:hypothetical protein